MKNIENDQYKVMMIVKSLVVKIQNGLTYEEITSAYVNLLDEEDKEHQRILCELIRTLYKTVPLYSLKGTYENRSGRRKPRSKISCDSGW